MMLRTQSVSPVHPAVRMRALRGLGQTCYGPSGTVPCPSTIPSPYSEGGVCPTPPNAPSGPNPVSTGITAAGSGLITASAFTGPAAPFVALAGILTSALGSLGIGVGCGNSCIEASDVVNYAECVMAQNLETYLGMPCPRSQAAQAAALQVFTSAWAYIVQSCSAIGGTGGSEQNCIAPRTRGGKYDYWANFYDPINNDTCVSADSSPVNAVTGNPASSQDEANTSAVAAVNSALGLSSSSVLPLVLIAAVVLLLSGAV